MDLLSDVVRVMHVEGRILCRWEVSAPYGVWFPPGDFMFFHLVSAGELQFAEDGQPTRTLRAGDVLLTTGGQKHQMTDKAGSKPRFIRDVEREFQDDSGFIRYGGDQGESAEGLTGVFRIRNGKAAHPLLQVLPNVMSVNLHQAHNEWLRTTFELYGRELSERRPGHQAVISRLTDVLFVHLVRAWMLERGADIGWLGAAKDPDIGRSLRLIHDKPAHPWGLEDLAHRVGMSRSNFAARFSELVGEPPMQYASRWRLQVAASLLLEQHMRVSEVASRVGYSSLAAFTRAFTRAYGQAPGKWRKQAAA
jgi:AraC-like DNA-binding protein